MSIASGFIAAYKLGSSSMIERALAEGSRGKL